MINVRGIANAAIQPVNVNQTISWVRSTGYTTDSAGHRTSIMSSSSVSAQIQAMSAGDLKHTDGLNIQGVMRAVYLYGNVQGVIRADQQGGDILQFPEVPGGASKNWRVISVVETWPTWAKVIVVLQ